MITSRSTKLTRSAGLLKAEDIEYVKFADISPGSEQGQKRAVELSNVKLDIDIFHFVEASNVEQPDQTTQISNADEPEALNVILHAKITSLPNRKLYGLWDSYVPVH